MKVKFLVHGIASICLFAVIWDFLDDFSSPDRSNIPFVYDVALAYLSAWLFHLMVVEIPQKRRNNKLLQIFRSPIMLIGNNGEDLIRSLEFVGRCPNRTIDKDHLSKLCMSLNNNPETLAHIAKTVSLSHLAYRRLEPFIASFPEDISIAIQEAVQHFDLILDIPQDFRVSAEVDVPENDIHKLRKPVKSLGGEPSPARDSLQGLEKHLLDYYVKTENVKRLTSRYFKGDPTGYERIIHWPNHRLIDNDHPFKEYPETAHSLEWTTEMERWWCAR